jgi:hypothetical protein
MQIALLSCYEALLDGLTKAYTNLSKLAPLGWGQPQYDALQQKLGAIRAAEAALFSATVTLNDRISAAQTALTALSPLLVAVGAGCPQPVEESSFRYSTSLSNSSSFPWDYPSGGIWVTDSSGYRLPDGCPCGSSSSSSTSSSSGGALMLGKGSGPGKFALKKTAKKDRS